MSYETTNPQTYCTRAEVQAILAEGDPAETTKIDQVIPLASRAIDDFKGVPVSYYNNGDAAGYGLAEVHWFDGNNEEDLYIDRCTSISELRMEYPMGTYTIWTENTDFVTLPYNTPYIARLQVRQEGDYPYWYWGQRNIRVTAIWGGYRETPNPVNMACIILCARYLHGARQMFEEESAISELGQIIWKDPEGQRVRNLLRNIEGGVYVG